MSGVNGYATGANEPVPATLEDVAESQRQLTLKLDEILTLFRDIKDQIVPLIEQVSANPMMRMLMGGKK